MFEYGDYLIESGREWAPRSVQVVQNNCLRICYNIPDPRDIRTAELHELCLLDKLIVHRKKHILCYNIISRDHLYILYINGHVILRSNSKIKLKVARPKGELYRVSPLYRAMLLWDELDHKLHHGKNVSTFKAGV